MTVRFERHGALARANGFIFELVRVLCRADQRNVLFTTLIRNAPTLYVDFDGTLHCGSALVDEAGHLFLESGGVLFEHAPLLVNLLAPYLNVQIVLSTSWLMSMRSERLIEYLPCGLRHRVVGDTNAIPSSRKPASTFL